MPDTAATQITFPRTAQITDAHCGPAVIQMMLANLGYDSDQKDLTKAAGIARTIKHKGSRIDHFVQMVKRKSKNLKLWYKDHARLNDIAYIIDNYKLPVAIEWQGLFGYKIDPATHHRKAINDGHYSLVVNVDKTKTEVTLVDPYKDFFGQDRIFSFRQFRKRWWDTNEIISQSGEIVTVYDYKLFFFIAPADIEFPPSLGLKPGTAYRALLPV